MSLSGEHKTSDEAVIMPSQIQHIKACYNYWRPGMDRPASYLSSMGNRPVRDPLINNRAANKSPECPLSNKLEAKEVTYNAQCGASMPELIFFALLGMRCMTIPEAHH